MTIAQLIEQLERIAASCGHDTQVFIDAPGITTPDVIVRHVRIGNDRVHLSSNYPARMRMR